MASRKRSRNVDDVDGDTEIESASSSFRQNQPKRSRVAMAAENGGSTISDDDEDEQDENDNTEHYSHMFDPEDEQEEIDDIEGMRFIQKQFSKRKENMPSEHGIIEEVVCRNFMCHSWLRVALGPLINFIIGHNGSGKSAVLTALTMCLGGKATATNRGASLKSLIKEGEESATLAVKIKNEGDGAYKPEQYGTSITVERHFSRSGTSGFKIKNAEGKVMSTKKGELDEILDFFAFQLDNPINVLTQDMARQFLSNSTPTDKYKFFIRGTQLETLDSDYKLLEEHLDHIEAKMRSREDDIDHLKRKADEAERKKKRLDQTHAIQQKITQAQYMHAWAQVEEQERNLQVAEDGVQSAECRVEEVEAEAEGFSGAYEGQNQALESAQRNLVDAQAQLEPIQQNHDQHKKNFDTHKADALANKTQLRNIREDRKAQNNEVARLEKEVKEETDRLASAEGPEHTARLDRLEQLKGAMAEAAQRLDVCKAERPSLKQQLDDARKAVADADQPIAHQKRLLEHDQGRLRELNKEQGNQWAGYKQNMQQLVKAVQQETRWRSQPVGPMGMYVQLRDPKWSSQIEKTLGGVLEAFVVAHKEDQTLLNQIMNRVRCSTSVYIGDPDPLDTDGNEPDAGVDTILRVLNITNDMVRNQLIINQGIDQTALFKDLATANKFMNGQQRPRNVRAAIARQPDGRSGVRLDFSRSGAAKTGPVHPWAGAVRMKTDREEQVKMLQESIDTIKREQHRLEQDGRNLRQNLEKAKQALERQDRKQRALVLAHQEAEDARDVLQGEIDSSRPQDGKLQELHRQLEEAKETVSSTSNSFQDAIVEGDKLGEKGAQLKPLLDEAANELNEANARIDNISARITNLATKRTNALRQKNLALQNVEDAKANVEDQQRRRDEQKAQVDSFTDMATRVCRRIPVEEGITTAALDERIEKLEQDLRRREAEAGGTREELTEAWQEATQAFRQAKAQLNGMTKFTKGLKRSLTERQHRWKMFRRFIATRARSTFAYLLTERQFRGRVIMDHRDKMLDIKVEPDLGRASDAGREAKTLSGGEKSFSTICLLLSIWDAMGSPIRCLDEFDVFMDSVNRATSMNMMIQAARRSVGRQFVLITPQAMNNVEMGEDVRVHRMSDPERGQTTLTF